MKRTMAVLTLLILALALISALPTMATPVVDKKIDVSILSIPTTWASLNSEFPAGQNPYYPAYFDSIRYFEPGHIMLVGPTGVPPADFETMQVWNTGYFRSTITIDGVANTAVSCNTQHIEYNAKTKNMVAKADAVWFIGSIGDIRNGFEGRVFVKYINYDIFTKAYDSRIVNADLQGFGVYEGQKLHLTYEGGMPPASQVWTGYVLMP
jgi:hypothetical protein